jgi:tetratricopeptide (TPR) repeat protein
MKSNFATLRALLACTALAATVTGLRAQDPKKDEAAEPAPAAGAKVIPDVDLGDPEGLGKAADEAFGKGQWLQAAANYNGLVTIGLKVGVPPAEMEPLYFIIGVCMFNLPNYDEALKRFTEYTQKYPTGPKIHQVNLAIARIFRAQKKWKEAIKQYKPLVDIPVTRDDALLELADAYKEDDQRDAAITLLESKLAPGLKNTEDVRAALYLVDLYEEKPEKGVAWLEKVKMTPNARAVVADINYAAMKVADALMSAEKFDEALKAFQNLRRKKEVLDTLKSLQGDYERTIASLATRTGPKVFGAAANLQRLDRLKVFLAQTKAMITTLDKEANYDAVLYYRIGRCFAALERYWEAKVAFQHVYDSYTKFEDRPNVLYALAYCLYMLTPEDPSDATFKSLSEQADAKCIEFLKAYGKDRSEAAQVADMRVNLANRTKDPARLNQVFEEVDEQIKGSANHSAYQAQRIHAYLGQYDFPKAKELADKYLADAPADDPQRELVEYMSALIPFFLNKYKDAQNSLGAYTAKYPNGPYTADATYRFAFLMKGDEMQRKKEHLRKTELGEQLGPPRFRNVIEKCELIISTYPGTDTVSNAWALIGDCYKEMEGDEIKDAGLGDGAWEHKAADAYMEAIKAAQNDSVAEYSLNMAAPLLKKQGRWEDVKNIYDLFRKTYPDHRISLQAVGEICKAIERGSDGFKAKELEEATKAKNDVEIKKILEERAVEKEKSKTQSREFLASTILENVNNPQKEGVEELMQQLAIAAIPKRKPAPRPAPSPGATTATPVKRPPPPTVAEQGQPAEAELDRLLAGGGTLSSVGKARLLYVKIQLYRDLEARQRPQRDEKGNDNPDTAPKRSAELEKQLLNDFKLDDYSSAMLALVGDKYYREGDKEYAARCFNRLIQFFPNSLFLDWAAVGLGDLALEAAKDSKGDVDPQSPQLERALKLYTRALDEFPGAKYGEAVMGRARIQYHTDKLEEAQTAFKEIVGDKYYPPETKAEATYYLGEILFKQKAYPDAFNMFQRLYLSFKKSAFWSCRGYLRAGETKVAMNKGLDARAVYKEAIEDPKNAERFKDLEDFRKIKENYNKL